MDEIIKSYFGNMVNIDIRNIKPKEFYDKSSISFDLNNNYMDDYKAYGINVVNEMIKSSITNSKDLFMKSLIDDYQIKELSDRNFKINNILDGNKTLSNFLCNVNNEGYDIGFIGSNYLVFTNFIYNKITYRMEELSKLSHHHYNSMNKENNNEIIKFLCTYKNKDVNLLDYGSSVTDNNNIYLIFYKDIKVNLPTEYHKTYTKLSYSKNKSDSTVVNFYFKYDIDILDNIIYKII